MNKKSAKIFIFIIIAIIICLCVIFFMNREDDQKGDNNSFIENNDIKATTEEIVANLIEEKDHYVLSVYTNIVEDKFTFSYDSNNFILDASSALFDNATFSEDSTNGYKKAEVQLESNTLYKLYFIKKNGTEMKVGKNLIIK